MQWKWRERNKNLGEQEVMVILLQPMGRINVCVHIFLLFGLACSRVLLRQHAAHMRRKSKQIMEELEQDRQLLEALLEKEADEVAIQTARKEKARADAAWMKEVGSIDFICRYPLVL